MIRAIDRFWGLPPSDAVHAEPQPERWVELRLLPGALELPAPDATIHLPGIRAGLGGEPLLQGQAGATTLTLASRLEEGSVDLAFDPDQAIAALLARRALTERAPLTARLPFHYHRVPSSVRRLVRDVATRRGAAALHGFPGWPVEPSVETVRAVYLAVRLLIDPKLTPEPFWPDGKRFALSLTHDVDTAAGLGRAPGVAAEEAARGLTSCWYLVGREYELDEGLLRELVDAGGEFGLHGDRHDNKLAFLPEPEIERRLDSCAAVVERLGMAGFRSPSMLRTAPLYRALARRFAYDSSMPDTGLVPGPNGCGSVFPFQIEGLTIVPLTVPPDGQLLSRGLSPPAVLAAWLEKVEWIRRVGGVAVHLTHPETAFSAARPMQEVYRSFLDWVAASDDAWCALPSAIAGAWSRRGAGAAAPAP